MKTTATLLICLLLASSVTAAEPASKPAVPATKGKEPVVQPAAAATPPAKKKEPVYELPKTGTNQPRSTGGWINAEVVGTRLVVKFFDKKKKPIAPDVGRGFALLKYAAKNPAKAPLNVDGMSLATPGILRPPHNFLLMLNLFRAGSEEPTETYSFRYP